LGLLLPHAPPSESKKKQSFSLAGLLKARKNKKLLIGCLAKSKKKQKDSHWLAC
jgi:hypothetical protein